MYARAHDPELGDVGVPMPPLGSTRRPREWERSRRQRLLGCAGVTLALLCLYLLLRGFDGSVSDSSVPSSSEPMPTSTPYPQNDNGGDDRRPKPTMGTLYDIDTEKGARVVDTKHAWTHGWKRTRVGKDRWLLALVSDLDKERSKVNGPHKFTFLLYLYTLTRTHCGRKTGTKKPTWKSSLLVVELRRRARTAEDGPADAQPDQANLQTDSDSSSSASSSSASSGDFGESEADRRLAEALLGNFDDTYVWSAQFRDPVTIKTKFSEAGRGMELSALQFWDDRLHAFDDRTGIMYELLPSSEDPLDAALEVRAVPRRIFVEGDGSSAKGFKIEWTAVKDGALFIGSHGREYTDNNGVLHHRNNEWVKVVTTVPETLDEHSFHVDWGKQYHALRRETNTLEPGYLVHEAAVWAPRRRQWFFFPRRVSHLPYNDELDERRGSNIVVFADEAFDTIGHFELGAVHPTHGYSDAKFLPNDDDAALGFPDDRTLFALAHMPVSVPCD
ncbi:MAG: hypothetical protein MHM6MM_003270 [Cercozoa sp. M6MM]